MSEHSQSSKSSSSSKWTLMRWPFVVVLLACMALYAFQFILNKVTEEAKDWRERTLFTASNAFTQVRSIPDRFKQGTLTQTFIAAIPTISATEGGLLEVAKAEATEIFRSAETKTIGWNWIDLGTTFTEIKVPVTYRYHIRMSDDWHLNRSGDTCIVFAPPIRASLPPAIHTDRMEKRSRNGWARFNSADQMGALERSLTPRLSEYAEDPRHLGMVRDQCRQTVSEFVQAWLLHEDQWMEGRFQSIRVVFSDEVPGLADKQRISLNE